MAVGLPEVRPLTAFQGRSLAPGSGPSFLCCSVHHVKESPMDSTLPSPTMIG